MKHESPKVTAYDNNATYLWNNHDAKLGCHVSKQADSTILLYWEVAWFWCWCWCWCWCWMRRRCRHHSVCWRWCDCHVMRGHDSAMWHDCLVVRRCDSRVVRRDSRVVRCNRCHVMRRCGHHVARCCIWNAASICRHCGARNYTYGCSTVCSCNICPLTKNYKISTKKNQNILTNAQVSPFSESVQSQSQQLHFMAEWVQLYLTKLFFSGTRR